MNPLAFSTDKYRIKEVEKDGTAYNDYSADTRILNLPSGIGGDFKVTYELTNPVYVANQNTAPVEFKLNQNYPNPFNPTTTISYSIAKSGKVSLKVYDLLGREVTTLINEDQAAGDYRVTFNAGNLSSGVYFYTMQAGNFSESRKLILLK
jgi:hypothetical protein